MSNLPLAPPRRTLHARRDVHAGRMFRSAPESLPGFIAAVLEPGVNAIALVAAHDFWGEPFGRPSMVLLLLALMLTFPGSARFRDEPAVAARDIAAGWLWLMSVLLAGGYATASLELFEPAVLATWALAAPALHWSAVMTGRAWLRWRARSDAAPRRAVVVGGGAPGSRMAQALRDRDDTETKVLGFFDDRAVERMEADAAGARLGSLAAVASYVQSHMVDDVYITLPLGSQPRIISLLETLQGTTASIHYVPDIFGISVIQGRLQDIGGVAVVGLCETPFTGVNAAAKRISDIVIASLSLLILSPLLLLLALGVRFSSPGPVIFRQRRNGLGGEEIVIYKFRTMRATEDGEVIRQATRHDDRITPFGTFLRRTSLDELPQFINVLQGRMSVVGPRPHAVAHNNAYRQVITAYMVRHKVRPGITGWAQINGHRGETATREMMQARVEHDIEYLRNWSLALDLEIVARTVRLVFSDPSAH